MSVKREQPLILSPSDKLSFRPPFDAYDFLSSLTIHKTIIQGFYIKNIAEESHRQNDLLQDKDNST